MWPSPKPRFKPAVWRYAAAKAALDQAGSFVPVEQAERRNLIMVNPIAGNVYATSRNIVSAYQMVKAGERARSHRHTAAALRLVVEAKPGTYTVVDGARIDMAPGDVVLTPSWCWHGHANESDATSYWIDFLDVPPAQQFYAHVTTLVQNGITVGVGAGMYGVVQPTLRQQMAVFILKSKHGLCYTPPPCTGVFQDVPCVPEFPFAPWIEEMAVEGITGGCQASPPLFCPANPVRRDQMAVFLLKGEHGADYVPPPCTGIFGDVACPSTFANWIEQLSTEGITGGCGSGNYCPANANTRGQMAVFLVKTFTLQ